jgi:hypothetical protein
VPVGVSLRRPLAEKVGMVSASTPTNQVYVKLPHFLTMKGTVGDPKRSLDALALANVALKTGAALVGHSGSTAVEGATGVLNTLGGLLTGKSTSPPATTSTPVTPPPSPAPSTPAPAATDAPATNVTTTNAPATNRPAVLNPLDLFRRKK